MPYPATPTLSVEAVHASVMLDAVPSRRTRFDGGVGGCVSCRLAGHTAVEAATRAAGERFPAASAATTSILYERPHASPVKDAVADVVVRTTTPFSDTRYCTKPLSSTEGAHVTENAESVAPETMRLRGALGGDVSAQVVVVTTAVDLAEWLPAASYASTETE